MEEPRYDVSDYNWGEEHTGCKEEGYKCFLDNGKEEINSLLWTYLPSNTTLKEADNLSMHVYEKICEFWDKYGE
jgi:hypothetical protein